MIVRFLVGFGTSMAILFALYLAGRLADNDRLSGLVAVGYFCLLAGLGIYVVGDWMLP